MIERVARAIWDVDAPEHRMEWDEETSAGKERYLCIARAALSALPSRELLAEALGALEPFAAQTRASGPTEERNIRRARAAADKIRAALTQEKKT